MLAMKMMRDPGLLPSIGKLSGLAALAQALALVLALVLALSAVQPAGAAAEGADSAGGAGSAEIDRAVWSAVATSVVEADIAAMAATYHPDAVLVSTKGTVAIRDQLVKWGEGMERARREGRTASVAFRFTSRQDGEATAFERGMFRYAETDANGVEQPVFVPFEALLVKREGRWLILMERQLEASDVNAWDALAR